MQVPKSADAPDRSPALEQLARRVVPGARLLRAWPLKGGISAGMTAIELAAPGCEAQKMIVRCPGPAALQLNPQAARSEFRLLQALRPLGVGAPIPRYLDERGQILGAPCLVLEYIEGEAEFAPSDPDSYAFQAAAALARIHSLDWDALGLDFLPNPAAGFNAYFGEPPAAPALPGVAHLRNILERSWPISQHNPTCLLHGDFWPGNLLWRDGRLAALIDWEDAMLGDPLLDFAGCRLEFTWIFGSAACDSFTRHYQALVRLDGSALPWWDLASALRLARLVGNDLAGWAGFFAAFGRPDITPQTICDRYARFTARALEKITAEI